MPNKNYVAIAQHMCQICGILHTHNTELLLHKRLGNIPDNARVTGYGLCEEHDRLFKEDFIALIGAEEPKGATHVKLEDAVRTGSIIHIKREVFKESFTTNIPDDLPMVFVSDEVVKLVTGWFEDTQG